MAGEGVKVKEVMVAKGCAGKLEEGGLEGDIEREVVKVVSEVMLSELGTL